MPTSSLFSGYALIGSGAGTAHTLTFPSSYYVSNDNGETLFAGGFFSYIPVLSSVSATRSVSGDITNVDTGFVAFPEGTFNVSFVFFNSDTVGLVWANWTLTETSLTINEWTFETLNDLPSEFSFHVGTRAAVPEPLSTLPAIALLAAGAAGVRSWRKRKVG